jgi:hypothetical protein
MVLLLTSAFQFETKIGGDFCSTMDAHVLAAQEAAQRRLRNARRLRNLVRRLAAVANGGAQGFGDVLAHAKGYYMERRGLAKYCLTI